MKTYSLAYGSHLQQSVTDLAVCWVIEKADGTLIRGTTHDRDIVIDNGAPSSDVIEGRYYASSGITGSDIKSSFDMSVDNMEVGGAFAADLVTTDLTVADVESGLFNDAPVQVFKVNWRTPNDFQEIVRRGYIGQLNRNAERAYQTEIRGLTQALQQAIGQTAGQTCNVKRFGDERCKFPVATATATGTVTAVTSNRRFNSTLVQGAFVIASPHFRLGRLEWLTGLNQGYAGQVKLDNVDSVLGHLDMWEPFFYDVQVGDTFKLEPGCDRTKTTCKDVYDNIVNMRAAGMLCPGPDQIVRAP